MDLEEAKMPQFPVSLIRLSEGWNWSQSDSEPSSERQKKLLEGVELPAAHKSWAGLSNTLPIALSVHLGVFGVPWQGKSPVWEQPGGGESWRKKVGIRTETDTGTGKCSSQYKQERLLVTIKCN